jgi:predicted short-subunit dehydrogenase-like oxidoreductase (DUF2520 family)
MASDSIVIIGPGRMGLALGAALRSRGAVHHLTYFGRSIDPPPHPLFDPYSAPDDPDDPPEGAAYQLIGAPLPRSTTIVILAVPDDALAEVAHDVLRGGPVPPGCAALHLSGALSTDVLTPLHAAGFSVGSMHPLMAVADPWLASEKLAGAAFSLAGEPTAIAAGRRIANALGGQTLLIASNARPIYHAAAVTASNHLVALISSAVRMLTAAGVSPDDGLAALLPLVRGTLDNVEQLGIPASLTGPIPRGDVDTVRLHLARLSRDDRMLYCALGLELLHLARGAGLDDERATAIESLLTTHT